MTEETVTTTRRRENTRQRLLDAAAQVFAEVGLDAASVEAVCERAGYTRGAFYSNFDSKEELFLELTGRVARERIAAVHARVGRLETTDAVGDGSADAFTIIQQVLDVSADDRLGVLLMSEIRNHALRNPALAEAYLVQDEEVVTGVARIVSDVARARGLTLRMPANDVARVMITTWEGAAVRSVMAGIDYAEATRRASEELGGLAQAIIDLPRREESGS